VNMIGHQHPAPHRDTVRRTLRGQQIAVQGIAARLEKRLLPTIAALGYVIGDTRRDEAAKASTGTIRSDSSSTAIRLATSSSIRSAERGDGKVERAGPVGQPGDHPRAEHYQHQPGGERLGHIAESDLLDLRGDLKHRDDQSDQQRDQQHRRGYQCGGPQHLVQQAECPVRPHGFGSPFGRVLLPR
jgi:hypothetical protein